jgi:membrane-associated phospholipid phosphatase
MIRYLVVGLLLCSQVDLAQTVSDSLSATIPQAQFPADTNNTYPQHHSLSLPTSLPSVAVVSSPERLPIGPLVAPALLMGYGFLTLGNPEFLESNEALQSAITGHYAGFHTGLDNYSRYVPLAAVYGLNLAGVEGKHDLVNLSMLFALSSFINNAITKKLKTMTLERRPDYPSFDAFPSGHTSTAFSNAELLHQEYKLQSTWYSVGGYSFAVATGALRMLNNRHWLSDVMAGAGVGILSTRLAYVIYPWLQQNINLGHFAKSHMAIAPMYQQGSFGLSMGLQLDSKKLTKRPEKDKR